MTTTTTTERIVCSGTLMTNEVREVLISALVKRCLEQWFAILGIFTGEKVNESNKRSDLL